MKNKYLFPKFEIYLDEFLIYVSLVLLRGKWNNPGSIFEVPLTDDECGRKAMNTL